MCGRDEEPSYSWQYLERGSGSGHKNELATIMAEQKYDCVGSSQAGEVWDIE